MLAHQLTVKIYAVTKTFPKEETYSLVDQISSGRFATHVGVLGKIRVNL